MDHQVLSARCQVQNAGDRGLIALVSRSLHQRHLVNRRLLRHLRASHQGHGGYHDGAARQDVTVHSFMQNQPTQKHGYNRVDIRVRGDFRSGHVIQQPDVCGVSHP